MTKERLERIERQRELLRLIQSDPKYISIMRALAGIEEKKK